LDDVENLQIKIIFISAKMKTLKQVRTLSCTFYDASKHDFTILGERKAGLL